MTALVGSRDPLELLGSRIVFKHPAPWEFFAIPGNLELLEAIAMTAPETVDEVVVITSTWRPYDPARGFSWHNAGRAVDWRTGIVGNSRAKAVELGDRPGSIVAPTPELALDIALEWAANMRARLGSCFDVILGDARHIDHGHAENDGGKRSRVHSRRLP